MPKGTNGKEMKRLAKGLKNTTIWQRGPDGLGRLGGEVGQLQAQQARHNNRIRAWVNDEGVARPPTPKKKGNPKKKNKKTPK